MLNVRALCERWNKQYRFFPLLENELNVKLTIEEATVVVAIAPYRCRPLGATGRHDLEVQLTASNWQQLIERKVKLRQATTAIHGSLRATLQLEALFFL